MKVDKNKTPLDYGNSADNYTRAAICIIFSINLIFVIVLNLILIVHFWASVEIAS